MGLALKILPIFVLILFGALGKRLGLFPERFTAAANRFVFYIAIPVLIFLNMMKSPASFRSSAWAAAVAVLALVVVWLGVLAAASALFKEEGEPGTKNSFIHCATHGNIAMMGLALAYFGLGQPGLFAATVLAAAVIPVQNVLAVVSLSMSGRRGSMREGVRSTALGIVTNPIILATVAAYLAISVGVELPRFLSSALGLLADTAIPLALLIIGANLTLDRASWDPRKMGAGLLFKLVILPGLGVLGGLAAGLSGVNLAALAMVLGAPTALISPIMAAQMRGDAGYAARMVTATTLACAVTSTVWLLILA